MLQTESRQWMEKAKRMQVTYHTEVAVLSSHGGDGNQGQKSALFEKHFVGWLVGWLVGFC